MWIFVLIIAGVALYLYLTRNRVYEDCVVLHTGAPRTGKTLRCVVRSVAVLKSNQLKVKIHNFFFRKDPWEMPRGFSNIPVLGFEVLTLQIVMLQHRIPVGSVVLIDEVSLWASQYEFDNPNIMDNFSDFCSLFGHFTGAHGMEGKLYLTTQATSKCVKQCRDCAGTTFYHRSFRKFPLVPIYCYQETVINNGEDLKAVVSDTKDQFKNHYGMFPSKPLYDSHCYSVLMKDAPVAVLHPIIGPKDDLKCYRVLRVPKERWYKFYDTRRIAPIKRK